MRILNPILQAAMNSGNFSPIVRAAVLDPDDHSVVQYLDLVYYKINGIDIEIEFYDPSGTFSDAVSLERGAKIGGVEYTIFSGIYKLTNSFQVQGGPHGLYKCTGSLVEPSAVEVAGDVTYQTVINSVMALGSSSAAFKDPAAAWLGYQFLADGQSFLTSNIFSFFALLRQKYMVHAAENGIDSILFYSVSDVLALASQYTITLNEVDTWSIKALYRQFIWKDELGVLHQPGLALMQIHNLGYLESSAAAPSIPDNCLYITGTLATVIPNLKYQTGDCVKFDAGLGGTLVKSVLDVTEIFDARAVKSGKPANRPAWYMELRPLDYFTNTPGGSIPISSEYTTAYSGLATNGFVGVLTKDINNVQALADAVDQYTPVKIRTTTPTIAIPGKQLAWSTDDDKLYVWTGAAWSTVGPYFTGISGSAPISVSAGMTPVISISGVDATHAGSVPSSGTPVTRKFLRALATTGAVGWDTLLAADIPDLSATYQPLDNDLTWLASISMARGMLIRGGASHWEGFAHGSANALLTCNGTDPLWSSYYVTGNAGQTYAFPSAGGTVVLEQVATAAETWIGPSSTAGIYFKNGKAGLGFVPLGRFCVDGGVHVGGASDPGDNNLAVDGNEIICGVRKKYWSGHCNGDQALDVDFSVPDEGGEGCTYHIIATMAHYSSSAYNCVRDFYLYARGSGTSIIDVLNSTSPNGGSWTASKTSATNLRVSHVAGVYPGGGAVHISVEYSALYE